MPTSIPYDPSLVLGNIVSLEKLENIEQIAQLQAPVNAAEDELNSFIAMKHSLDMTIQEMVDMGVDTSKLQAENQKVGQNIEQAGINFAEAKLEAEQKIQPLRSKISTVSGHEESPIDYLKSQLKTMPLAADSLNMNCQYFAFDSNQQDSSSHAAAISSYAGAQWSEGGFGESVSDKTTVKNSIHQQVHQQYQAHDIVGTLVISINCTHKDAQVFAPYVLNVDKGIRVWNDLFPKDELNVMNPGSIYEAMMTKDQPGDNVIHLLSGATYGSSFIGMVHVLNSKTTITSQDMESVATELQTQMKGANWFEHVSGGFGGDNSIADSAKNMLSQQNVQSHCTMMVMGSIPSIKANNVKMAVEQFSNFSGSGAMTQLTNMMNDTGNSVNSMSDAATAAQTGGTDRKIKCCSYQAYAFRTF